MTETFPVDPQVMQRIRRMRASDATDVARLHRADMGRSLWARLGGGFLEALYEGLIESPWFLGFVYEEDGSIGGFIAGTTNGSRLFADVSRRHGLRLAWKAFLGVVRQPSLLRPLVTTPLYFRRSRTVASAQSAADAIDDATVSAESLFCSFVPHLRGRRVSGHINKVLFDELAWLGQSFVKVTTEDDNHGAIRQLERWGFGLSRRFHFYGKAMRAYVLDLRSSPRVSPARHDDRGKETTPAH